MQRVGCAIKCLGDGMKNFDKHHCIPDESDKHTVRSDSNGFEKVVKQIFNDSNVFDHAPARCHTTFPGFTPNTIRKLKPKSLELWMTNNIKKIFSKLDPLDSDDVYVVALNLMIKGTFFMTNVTTFTYACNT